MSRTTNSQNALVNLLRPTITYDSGVGFVPKLVLSNIDVLTANQIVTDNFQFGGVGGNVFIGSNVGGGTGNSNNVGIGVSALAGASSTTGTVAIGFNALQSANGVSNSVGIGTGVVGGGVSNVIVGANAGSTGECNVILGAGMNGGSASRKLYIGYGGISNTTIGGDLQQRRVGIATSDPQTTLDVSGSAYIREYLGVGIYPPQAHVHANGLIYATSGFRAQGGSATEPAFSFIDDSGTGFYQVSNGFAITNKGIEQVLIQDASFGIRGDLWVSGSVNISGTGAVNQTLQGYLRIPSSVNPTIDISGDSIRVDGSVKAGGSLRTDGSIRVGTFTSPTVDISGSTVSAATLRGTTATITPIVRDATVPSGFDLSGGSLRLASNVELNTGFVRSVAGGFRVGPLLAPTTDISGGNIRLTGHLDISTGTPSRPSLGFITDGSSGLHSGGTSILAFDTSGIQRMTLSNGNLGIGKATPVVALEVVGDVSATTYNGPGGTAGAPHYTFSDDRTTGLFFPGNNIVGFTAGGTERMRISNATIGIGTTAPTSALEISGGVLRITGPSGEITFSNGTINAGLGVNISGTPIVASNGAFSNSASTSNSLGGVVLSNSNAIVGGFLRNALIPSQFDISGGNISNSGTVRTTNLIGSGFLRNALIPTEFDISGGNISNSGTVRTTNLIGSGYLRNALTPSQFDISGGNISNSGTHTSSNFIGTTSASNRIGGVTLSNTDICMGGTITLTSTDTTKINFLPATSVGTTGPRIAHSGGWNTQFFAGATNQPDPTGIFTFNTAAPGSNVERMRIASNGFVGINTAAPGYNLDVSGQGGTGNVLSQFRNPSGDAAIRVSAQGVSDACGLLIFQSSTQHGFSIPSHGNPLVFSNNAAERMRITSTGNVGIALTNPSYPLDVLGKARIRTSTSNTAGSNTLIVQNDFLTGQNLTGSDYVAGSVLLAGGTGSLGSSGEFYGVRIGAVIPNGTFQDNIRMGFFTPLGTNNSFSVERMTIVSGSAGSGNVGIAKLDPQYRLDVCDGTIRSGELRVGSNQVGYGAIKIQGGSGNNTLFIQDVSTTTLNETGNYNGWIFGSVTTSYGSDPKTLKFYRVNNGGNATSLAVAIASNGNVGIAATNPTKTLDVCGSVRASGGLEGPGTIPIGGIIMWSGATVPSGWQLCDGTNSTPDLRDRFIVGSGSTYSISNTGGASNVTLSIANLPPHTHTVTAMSEGNQGINGSAGGRLGNNQANTTSSVGSATAFSILPPYYALAFIMRMI